MTPHPLQTSSPSAVLPPTVPTVALAPPFAAQRQRKRVSSQELLANEREIEIEHVGQLYRLRLTSLGKLILTK